LKILFVGDIFGRPGRKVASEFIPKIRERENVDFCIANGENVAGGYGITENCLRKLFSYGVDVVTSGNHVWDRPDADQVLSGYPRLLRPANYPPGVAGNGNYIVELDDGSRVGVINLQGRIFMPPIDCPFRVADRIIEQWRNETDCIIVDFHAEATSEKIALGWFLDGRVSAVLGTHTHVMTADERILPGGTAFISDVGMTGPHKSIIGVRVDQSLSRIIKQVPSRFTPATQWLTFSAVLVEIDDSTGKALSIKRIVETKDEPAE